MQIQWFPGHMAKSLRLIEASAKSADVIIYVLDARAPKSCFNPALNTITERKPVLYVLNKADLADGARTEEWIKAFSDKGACIAADAKSSLSIRAFVPAIKRLAAARIAKYAGKDVNYTVKGMIVGVPNCGKSTIINGLAGGAKAKVGNKPGVTRGKQWLSVSDTFDLMDTPGVLWGDLTNQATARRLAFIGCVRDDVVDMAELALSLIEELYVLGYGDLLAKRYKLEGDVFNGGGFNPEDIFNRIALKRGCLLPGGVTDRERAAVMILDEFRNGVLGKITLEKFPS